MRTALQLYSLCKHIVHKIYTELYEYLNWTFWNLCQRRLPYQPIGRRRDRFLMNIIISGTNRVWSKESIEGKLRRATGAFSAIRDGCYNQHGTGSGPQLRRRQRGAGYRDNGPVGSSPTGLHAITRAFVNSISLRCSLIDFS